MQTKTKTIFKKALAITGLGLLLIGAVASTAYLCHELAHKPSKANVMAKAESETISDLKGSTWLFNDIITISYSGVQPGFIYDINFSSNNSNYVRLSGTVFNGANNLYYGVSTSSENTLVYTYVIPSGGGGAEDTLFGLTFEVVPLYWVNSVYQTIKITGGDDTTNSDLINWLYENATLQSVEPTLITGTISSFVFAEQINYHAPYSQDIDSYFVSDSTMTNSASTTTKTLLENIKFSSGGQEFNSIRARYISAEAQYYYTSNNSSSYSVWSASGFASYMWLEYYNSETNKLEIVNTRLTQAFNTNTSSGVVQLKGSKWVSANYRTITFIDQPTEVQITTLSTLNNTSANIGYYNNSDIGLGNAFTLLGQAFTSWAGLLGIQVLPNISLGLLIFLPLVVGIIILIIWIVKR